MSATTSAAPAFITVTLPPGMDEDAFEKLQAFTVNMAIVSAVGFAIVCWDYLLLLPEEIKLYIRSSRQTWRSPGTYAFIVLRYSGIFAFLAGFWISSLQSEECMAPALISQTCLMLVVAASGLIFCYRVIAVWSGNKWIQAVVFTLYALLVGSYIAVLTQYRAVVGAPTPFGSNCQLQPMVSWAPICFAMSVAFDSIMLILVIAKLPSRLSQKSRIAHIFYRDSLLYFLATTTTNIIIMAIVAQGDSFSYIKAVSIPWNTVITYAMGTRTYLHLKMSKEQEMTPSVARLLPSQYGGASLSTQSQTHTIPSFPTPRSPPVSAYPNPRKEFAPMTLPVSVTKERSNPVDCL